MSSDDVKIIDDAERILLESRWGQTILAREEVAALREYFAAEQMPDDVQVRELNLPTEPGFYELEDGVAQLHPDGTWSDGWGNPLDSNDMEDLQNAIPLVRKMPSDR